MDLDIDIEYSHAVEIGDLKRSHELAFDYVKSKGYNESILELKDIISKNGKVASELISARNQAHTNALNPTIQSTPESANTGIATPHAGNWKGNIQEQDTHKYFEDDPESVNALHTALNNYTKAIETYNEIANYTD